MYQLQAGTIAALRDGPTIDNVIEVYSGGGQRMIASSYTTPTLRLDTSKGGVNVARKSKFSRSFTATVDDASGILVPMANQPYLDPLLRPWVKLYEDIFWDDSFGAPGFQRIPLGGFSLDRCVGTEMQSGATLDLSGNDIATFISQNPWTTPFTVGGTGVKYHTAIQSIITDRAQNFTPQFSFEESTMDCPEATFDENSDPWDQAQKLAQAAGMELFVSINLIFVLRTIPEASKVQSVWYFDESEFSRREDGMQRSIDTADVYNGVIVTATAPWLLFAIVGTAWDTDPTSPTYYKGPMGMKPERIDNALVGDQAGADAAALAELKNVLGVMENVSYTAVRNPALEQGDGVTVGSDALKIEGETLLIETIGLSFDVTQSMSGTSKRQRRL